MRSVDYRPRHAQSGRMFYVKNTGCSYEPKPSMLPVYLSALVAIPGFAFMVAALGGII